MLNHLRNVFMFQITFLQIQCISFSVKSLQCHCTRSTPTFFFYFSYDRDHKEKIPTHYLPSGHADGHEPQAVCQTGHWLPLHLTGLHGNFEKQKNTKVDSFCSSATGTPSCSVSSHEKVMSPWVKPTKSTQMCLKCDNLVHLTGHVCISASNVDFHSLFFLFF